MSLPQKDACKQCQDKHPNSMCLTCSEHSHDYGKQPYKHKTRFMGENSEYCSFKAEADAKKKSGGVR